jgi:hypothetical protein
MGRWEGYGGDVNYELKQNDAARYLNDRDAAKTAVAAFATGVQRVACRRTPLHPTRLRALQSLHPAQLVMKAARGCFEGQDTPLYVFAKRTHFISEVSR